MTGRPTLDDLFAKLDAAPHDEAGLYAVFDRMKFFYPEAMDEIRQRIQAEVTQAKREYARLHRMPKAPMTERLTLTLAHWFSDVFSGIPVQRAALGDADLSVMHIGPRWSWLVRRDGHDVAEGAADSLAAAQEAAEAAAIGRLLLDWWLGALPCLQRGSAPLEYIRIS